ncbi:NnrS family protein, partial [Methyloceanibacter marginalis]|uniref:NnrS family protein n=1 Tax=Methyloceanibacter marginalis TaxID=1774971 RepID=UPI000AF3A020
MQRSLREERGTGQGNLLRALLSYGFRPFFLGAALWAILALTIWLGALAGRWELAPGYGALPWHAHEM